MASSPSVACGPKYPAPSVQSKIDNEVVASYLAANLNFPQISTGTSLSIFAKLILNHRDPATAQINLNPTWQKRIYQSMLAAHNKNGVTKNVSFEDALRIFPIHFTGAQRFHMALIDTLGNAIPSKIARMEDKQNLKLDDIYETKDIHILQILANSIWTVLHSPAIKTDSKEYIKMVIENSELRRQGNFSSNAELVFSRHLKNEIVKSLKNKLEPRDIEVINSVLASSF
ncbi:MAG: hypothetical protein AB8E15_07880 [Bdellovibrionales bacterium]